MRSVAVDLGVRKICLCEVEDERVVARATVREFAALQRWLGPNTPPACVAVEASREAWHVTARLRAWGHEPIIVDTTRVKRLGVGQHGRKTDRIDAEVLARAVASGTIPRAHVLSPHRQQLRRHLSVRRALVETRAQYVTTLRGLVRAAGERLPRASVATFDRRVHAAPLSAETQALVAPLLPVLTQLTQQIAVADAKLATLAAREPIIAVLTTAPGVATLIAAAFVSVVDDARRFRTAHQVEAYLGLVPLERSTGGRRRIGAITKQGNPYLRTLLVQAAWNVLRTKAPDDPLKRWGEAVLRRRGKRIAMIAIARRLTGVLWAMWRDGTAYRPQPLRQASATGLGRAATTLRLEAARMARTPTLAH